MKKLMSANELFKNLAQNLDFEFFIFDDPPSLGDEIKLREKSKRGEIDAILFHQNVFCLVGINKGRSENVNKEIEKFFEKLDKTDKVLDLQLDLEITTKNKGQIKDKIKIADDQLEKIKDHINKTSRNYDLILKKIFFCPHKQIGEEIIEKGREENKIIIDKDIFEYFEEVLNRLDKRFLFYDFIHFLGIRKINLEKRGASKTRKPPKSSPYKVTRMELEKDKIIMYSLSPRVEDIIKYITVLRMARKYDKKGFQRMIKSTRLNKMNEYLDKNETFPNNIIIALDPEIYKKEEDFYISENGGEITFFDEYNSLIIIDGQHRFFSFVKGDKLDRHVLITLIFFKEGDKDDLMMEKLFYKINKTQERIDPNLSFILEAKIDPNSDANFWYNVFRKLDKKGYFAGKFSFKETTIRGDPKKSIISVITYGGVLRLNKKVKKQGIEVDGLETFYTGSREENISFSFNLLKNYFDIVETVLYSQTINKNDLTPREIGALIRIIKHFIIADKNKLKSLGENRDIIKSKSREDKIVVSYFKDVLSNIPFRQTIDLDYPTSNWAAIEGYMLKKINTKNPSFGNKNLLSKKGYEIYNTN
jgi:DGQHR domain-containing protein